MDLPFSVTFYRWLLGHEPCLTLADLKLVNPEIYKTLRKMQHLVKERDEILANPDLTNEEKTEQVNFFSRFFDIKVNAPSCFLD